MRETVLKQSNFQPQRNFDRTLWLFVCVAIFVIVFGFISNLVSTDLVAEVRPATIDRLEDFFSDVC